MSRRIVMNKATRIEGNAHFRVEIDGGRVRQAQFLVHDFRGFERFTKGREAQQIPHLISRICGLCSTSHHVAGLKAIESALGVKTPRSVASLREIAVLGEWIASHSLSYFYLTYPDFVGASSGVFELMQTHPEVMQDAQFLRHAGQGIVEAVGGRATHPIRFGVGRFLKSPETKDLETIRRLATEIRSRVGRMIKEIGPKHTKNWCLRLPTDIPVRFLAFDENGEHSFSVFDRDGKTVDSFACGEFPDHVHEMRAEWTFAKFPYLARFGFPGGTLMVGPLARIHRAGGLLDSPALKDFELTSHLRGGGARCLEAFDVCRLLEVYWAADEILRRLDEVVLDDLSVEVNLEGSGQGIGVLEAPRGTLVHSYLIDRGRLESMNLLVATQFNNAFINLLLKEIASAHVEGDGISAEGNHLINRCIRLFDPCLSCATH